MKVLIADDDASTRAALKILLSSEGYEICWATDGRDAIDAFRKNHPDLVILDVMMPVLNGFEVCELIRKDFPTLPVLFLSAKGEIEDRKCGLRLGADDYMAKPFDSEELLLRVRALARRSASWEIAECGRRSSGGSPGVIAVGAIEINGRRHEVCVDGRMVSVTPNEFRLLALLAERAGEVVTQRELVEELWGDEYAGEPTSIAVYVRHIREKIEPDPSKPMYIQTVWGIGYRLCGG